MLSYVVFGVATRLHRNTFLVNALSTLGYILWICLPPLAASLAFVNGGRYTNQGTFCLLPVRPFWYRLGLSWIPRYVLLFTSSFAVLWLFVYVKLKHRSFMHILRKPDESYNQNMPPPGSGRTGSSHLSAPNDDFSLISPTSPTFSLADRGPVRKQVSLQVPQSPHAGASGPQNMHSNGTNVDSMATNSVTNSADEVLRRLRRLWVYPLVYFIYWTVPFVYHAMAYRYYYVIHPIPAIAGLSSTFIGLQCACISIAVWIFERPTTTAEEVHRRISVWEHLRDAWRPASVFNAQQWEKTAEQRQSAIFAKQRLAIEQQERRTQRARHSALSSRINVRDSLLDEAEENVHAAERRASSGSVEKDVGELQASR